MCVITGETYNSFVKKIINNLYNMKVNRTFYDQSTSIKSMSNKNKPAVNSHKKLCPFISLEIS